MRPRGCALSPFPELSHSDEVVVKLGKLLVDRRNPWRGSIHGATALNKGALPIVLNDLSHKCP